MPEVPTANQFNAMEAGAISHLYRGEVYRSTVWRTRLDTTTNWAVVTTGLALSLSFSGPDASPLPLALVGLLVAVFLFIEARRYRYFDMWQRRTRMLEINFLAPILSAKPVQDSRWGDLLAEDYRRPSLHIGTLDAVGRRLRRNYGWIFLIQVTAYAGKLLIHPTTVGSLQGLWERAAIGPVAGQYVLLAGLLFHGSWIAVAIFTWPRRQDSSAELA